MSEALQLATALLLLVACAVAGAEDTVGLHAANGARFAEVRYRTPAPCATRVEVTAAGETIVLRPRELGETSQHRVLVPLPLEGRATVAAVLSDGTRSAPLELRRALRRAPHVTLETRGARAGPGLELFAHADVDALWTLLQRRGDELTRQAGPTEPTSLAVFALPELDPEGEIPEVKVEARFVEGLVSARAGPIPGNARIAKAVRAAADAMSLPRFTRMLLDPRTRQAVFAAAFAADAARAGLETALDVALPRASSILGDARVDGPSVRLPFSYALDCLGGTAHLALERGWTLHGHVGLLAPPAGLSWPKAPPPDAVAVFKSPLWNGCATWPGRAGGGPESCTIARLSEPKRLKELETILVEATPSAFTVVNRGRPFHGLAIELKPQWLRGREVRLFVETAGLEPDDVLYLDINDSAMVALRNRKSTYPGEPFSRISQERPITPSL
ncbi:MAG: hypothetical protein HY303_18335, partial [Candidatus Wallbacteria bacterium]|nr:hypothetical protein [Candidatus Wallbacteria bacterium]